MNTHTLKAATALSLALVCGAGLASAQSAPSAPRTYVVSQTSQQTNHPSLEASTIGPPAWMHVVGGGAIANFTGVGSMLWKTAPDFRKGGDGVIGWQAAAKDHIEADPATLTAFSIVMRDDAGLYQVEQFTSDGAMAAHPTARAVVEPGWVMTGGGCVVHWQNGSGAAGSMLTASYPDPVTKDAWVCAAKDHNISSPAYITAYVVGIKAWDAAAPAPQVCIETSSPQKIFNGKPYVVAHPSATVTPSKCKASDGWMITGGGARAQTAPGGGGQLLTASVPVFDANASEPAPIGWKAASKDHLVSSPGHVMAYVVSIKR